MKLVQQKVIFQRKKWSKYKKSSCIKKSYAPYTSPIFNNEKAKTTQTSWSSKNSSALPKFPQKHFFPHKSEPKNFKKQTWVLRKITEKPDRNPL